jgi:hypothetical protein
VCRTCADDCDSIGGMSESATVCRSCAEVCTDLARLDHEEILTMASQLAPSA